MAKLIIIHGPIATGKSTISKLLLENLNDYVFVDKEYFKYMLKKIGKENAKKISTDTSLFIIKELMKLNKNIITQEMSMKTIFKKLKNYSNNYEIISFYLQCSLSTTIKRDKIRDKKSGNIEHIKRIYEKVKPSKEDIIIDTENNSINNCVIDILKHI